MKEQIIEEQMTGSGSNNRLSGSVWLGRDNWELVVFKNTLWKVKARLGKAS